MKLRTKTNLIAAMQCGALDAAKYQRFAACARMDGDWELAKAFQDAADSNRMQHFSRKAELEGLVADSPDNLRKTIEAEANEANMFAELRAKRWRMVTLMRRRCSTDSAATKQRRVAGFKPCSKVWAFIATQGLWREDDL